MPLVPICGPGHREGHAGWDQDWGGERDPGSHSPPLCLGHVPLGLTGDQDGGHSGRLKAGRGSEDRLSAARRKEAGEGSPPPPLGTEFPWRGERVGSEHSPPPAAVEGQVGTRAGHQGQRWAWPGPWGLWRSPELELGFVGDETWSMLGG